MPDVPRHGLPKPTVRHQNKPKEGEVGNSYGKADPERWRPYNYRWKQARLRYLRRHPLCAHCQYEELITPATEIDHIIPHKGDMNLFWDQSNWMPLCASCHSKKTYKEGKHAK